MKTPKPKAGSRAAGVAGARAANKSSLGHKPDGTWSFDEGVTDVFDDMLKRSIPQYDEMRSSVADLAARYAQPFTYVVDIGCSRGEAIATVRSKLEASVAYAGVEVSPPMLAAAKARFADDADVEIIEHDLRAGLPQLQPKWGRRDVSVVLSILTIQFTPIEYRQRIVASIYDRLAPGGAFIFVEKILGATAKIDETLVNAYYDRKRASGYSEEEIQRKRHALEGVLVPVTARWNEELLRGAGFVEVDGFWRSLNFAGWLAIKR